MRAASRAGRRGGRFAESAAAEQLPPERELLRAAPHHLALCRIQLQPSHTVIQTVLYSAAKRKFVGLSKAKQTERIRIQITNLFYLGRRRHLILEELQLVRHVLHVRLVAHLQVAQIVLELALPILRNNCTVIT